eukprot:jgi/Galph1/3874/GphlegSOOS_G2556.1
MTNDQPIVVILLAAGFGTRLAEDIEKDETKAFANLLSLPKPLLPVGGKTIIDHWLEVLNGCRQVTTTVILTNAKYYPQFEEWKKKKNKWNFKLHLISNAATHSENRLGAIRDLHFAINYLKKEAIVSESGKIDTTSYLVIAGDTLVPFLSLEDMFQTFHNASTTECLVLAYEPRQVEELSKRGVFRIQTNQDSIQAVDLIEKPKDLTNIPSSLASIPVYLFSSYLVQDLEKYLGEQTISMASSLPKQVDAPGYFIAWLCSVRRVTLYITPYRLDIGNLQQYQEALWFASCSLLKEPAGRTVIRASEGNPQARRALPRAGFIGNPSDGYGGKVISFTIENAGFAQVIAVPHASFLIVPHPQLDAFEFSSLKEMSSFLSSYGFYGGLRLLQAACIRFFKLCEEKGIDLSHSQCKLHYSTDIPRQVGMGGSSAILVACFRCLASFYGMSMLALAPLEQWPTIILECETEELSISAGLQDRVIQVMEGAVYMDFSNIKDKIGKYERLNARILPELYIAWLPVGKFSGAVHSNLKARWQQGDPVVVNGMQNLSRLTDEIMEEWKRQGFLNSQRLAIAVEKNFAYRRAMIGESFLGQANRAMIGLADRLGMAAKFVGSGGAILCVPKQTSLSLEEEEIQQVFLRHNFHFQKIQVACGQRVEQVLNSYFFDEFQFIRLVVADEKSEIEEKLCRLCDEDGCSLVFTTGGTGPAPRDVTPEATDAVCNKLLPGFGEAMRSAGREKGVVTAILARQQAGIRNNSLIVNLPGGNRAVRECMEAILPCVKHCIELINGPILHPFSSDEQLPLHSV